MNSIKQIHAHSLRNGTDQIQLLLLRALQIPNIAYAQSLLESAPTKPTTFLYNKLLQAYFTNGSIHHCLSLYSQMRLRSCPPNLYSFTFLFSACASVSDTHKQGQVLHAQFLKFGFQFDAYVLTSLLDMYAKSGLLTHARLLFDEMPERDVASWNSMIGGYAKGGELGEARNLFDAMPFRNVISWTSMVSGYSQNGQYEEAISTFLRMWDDEWVRPNEVTIASVLPSCANLGAMDLGARIDRYIRDNGFASNLIVSNALMDMYAKCGNIDQAKRVFVEIGKRKNLCSWNSMIMGLAVHGRWKEALELFQEMREEGRNPDDITLVGVLLACTHGGLVDQGCLYFETMESQFSIFPKLEHYGCMVDLLGRAGHLKEAYSLITSMPVKPDSVIWGALLGACSFYGEIRLAAIASKFLSELEPWNPGNYVILSNIYASLGRWDGVAEVWRLMKGKHYKKAAGYSCIELGGTVHKFLVEDKIHPLSSEIYALLDEIATRIKTLGRDFDFHVENHY